MRGRATPKRQGSVDRMRAPVLVPKNLHRMVQDRQHHGEIIPHAARATGKVHDQSGPAHTHNRTRDHRHRRHLERHSTHRLRHSGHLIVNNLKRRLRHHIPRAEPSPTRCQDQVDLLRKTPLSQGLDYPWPLVRGDGPFNHLGPSC